MNITEIREHIKRRFGDNESTKSELTKWLAHNPNLRFTYGLTLMPKKVFYKYVPQSCGVKLNMVKRHLTKEELAAACMRYFAILNKLIYKNAYKRFGKTLDAVMTIEGERSFKDLHAHFALACPSHLNPRQFARCVRKALELSGEFEIDNKNYDAAKDSADKKYWYKLDIVDCGWIYYITKELDKQNIRNMYFL